MKSKRASLSAYKLASWEGRRGGFCLIADTNISSQVWPHIHPPIFTDSTKPHFLSFLQAKRACPSGRQVGNRYFRQDKQPIPDMPE